MGDLFLVDQNSEMSIVGQLSEEAGPCPDHVFLILQVRGPPNHTRAESLLGG